MTAVQTGSGTMMTETNTTVADSDQANFSHCMHFATKGLNDARTLAHKLIALQKEANALREAFNGGIEARKLKFWIFSDWWVKYLCR